MPLPWPHFYEHPLSVASIAVERDYRGEKAVFFGHLRAPEDQSLTQLDARLRELRERPVESFGLFRRLLAISRLPRPLRRAFWWVGLHSSGSKRAARIGTFGVSVYSHLGAESYSHYAPLTTSLSYGVFAADGSVVVRVIYDHRVMDGATVARALACLEEVLCTLLVSELSARGLRLAA
jgi:hypothetical protein